MAAASSAGCQSRRRPALEVEVLPARRYGSTIGPIPEDFRRTIHDSPQVPLKESLALRAGYRRQDLAAVIGDQHVLLEAHAAEPVQFIDTFAVDVIAAACSGEEGGNDIDAR